MEKEKKNKILFFVFGGFGLYLLSAGISYAAFKHFGGVGENQPSAYVSPLPAAEGRQQIDTSAPKNEICPLTGEKFTQAERAIWEKRRPLGIMVENHLDSRPQSGLSQADIVYEAVAEGGITRFMGVFFCRASAADIMVGPVRSARTYFLDWISEYGSYPLYTHVGGANDFDGSGKTAVKARALEQIGDYGWELYNDLSGMSLSYPTFWRDYERLPGVATEHTMYSRTDRLWEAAEKRGLTQVDEEGERWDKSFVSWNFKDGAALEDRAESQQISFEFWENSPQYAVKWVYNRQDNLYLRSTGDQPHKDMNDDQQLAASVVVIQFVKETGPVDENKHMLYGTTGQGDALVFQDGAVTKAKWAKADRLGRTVFTAADGSEIEFNRGRIWLEIVPLGNEVSY